MDQSELQTNKMTPDYFELEPKRQNSNEKITNIELTKGQFKKVKPRYVQVDKTVEWSKNKQNYPEAGKTLEEVRYRGNESGEAEEDGLCRMESYRKKTTNATILRDHLNKIRKAFEKFQTQHSLLLAKQK